MTMVATSESGPPGRIKNRERVHRPVILATPTIVANFKRQQELGGNLKAAYRFVFQPMTKESVMKSIIRDIPHFKEGEEDYLIPFVEKAGRWIEVHYADKRDLTQYLGPNEHKGVHFDLFDLRQKKEENFVICLRGYCGNKESQNHAKVLLETLGFEIKNVHQRRSKEGRSVEHTAALKGMDDNTLNLLKEYKNLTLKIE